jgi:hypothetical protein
MKLSTLYFILLLSVISACAGENNNSDINNNTTKAVVKEQINSLVIEPQITFDQSQMSRKVEKLCFKFRNFDGRDRKEIFNQFEVILPSCPIKQLADNKMEVDIDNAQQIMTVNDLKEILGKPNEIREDGMLVYNLLGDGSYRVAFHAELNGSVSCRFYEAES